ncbi:fimbrial protein [Serratia fonticola]|uniref:fimbrial protein n=1 Tax=Serratia fonticola TaxID=47917 RepID=UPI0015C5DBF6|nr:fimbrial protein [Serratia fonticola]MBC3378344.1 fimbrial protein [Serratia fonticola]NYA37544.1 fimbrial protein [Serratia fonticola]
MANIENINMMIFKVIKKTVSAKIGLALALAVFSQQGYASLVSCTAAQISSFTIPGSVITVQRDLPVNSPISGVIYGNQYNNFITCLNPTTTEWVLLGMATTLTDSSIIIDNHKVYKTDVPGVGVAIGGIVNVTPYWINSGSNLWGDVNGQPLLGASKGSSFSFTAQPFIRFYKIGPISSGTITGQQIALFKSGEANGNYRGPEIPINLSAIQVNSVACTINTPVIQVPLADVNINEFSGVNSTLRPKEFSVGLDCDAGAKINVSMSGVKNTDTSANGVLQLTGAGTQAVATGVGIQILYNSAPLVINNILALKTSAGGQETFPFTAQYYQTASKVTGGIANSTMTLNITYQ